MKLINKTNNQILAEKIEVADNPFKRMKGLLGRDKLEKGEGLHIIPCNNIHSFFMKFEFDAVFTDKKNKVKYLAKAVKPWTWPKFCFSAYSVIELPSGVISETGTKTGDKLEFIEQNKTCNQEKLK